MSGLFDIHALIALQNGWSKFVGSTADPLAGTGVIADGESSVEVTFPALPHAEWVIASLVGDPALGVLSVTGKQTTGFVIGSTTPAAGGNGSVSWTLDVRYGLTNFRRIFPMVETAVVDSWFEGLVADSSVTFRSYASPGNDDFPLVILQLMSEQADTEMIGSAAREWEDGDPSQYVDALVVNQEIEVTIMTKSHELTRALFVAVRAILMRYTNTFLSAGYLDIKFLHSAELAPEERLIAEDAGVFVRKQRWRALAQVEAFPIEDAPSALGKPWWIQQSDIISSTNPTPPPARMVDLSSGSSGGVVILDE
jgi:hypothetical protein